MSSRKEREKAQHRQLILQAAEAVFARKGFGSATVHEIAERAEFSVGYLYNMFASKEEIFAELVDMRAAEYIAQVEERMRQQQDVLEKVRTAIAAKLDFFREHEQFFRIFSHLMAGDRPGGPAPMSEKCHRRYHSYMGRLADIFAEGIRRGLFIDVQPIALVVCMEGMTNSAIAQWVYSGGKDFGAVSPEVIQKVLLEGILAQGSG